MTRADDNPPPDTDEPVDYELAHRVALILAHARLENARRQIEREHRRETSR